VAGRPQLIVKQRFLPPAHFVRGSDMFFVLPSVPPRGGSTLGYYYVALRAQNSSGFQPDKFQFVG
ncbi:MAG: hypothetical protein J6J97_05345, partial [Akkermansia sp.]|nr:hypothetical protein [Akkermansia sp.]